jgi:hypothetical protein
LSRELSLKGHDDCAKIGDQEFYRGKFSRGWMPTEVLRC